MSTWQLIRELLHGANFVWKKFIILSIVVLVIITGIAYIGSRQKSEAEFAFSTEPQFSSIQSQTYNIEIKTNGTVIVNGHDASRDLKIYRDYDEVQVLLVDVPGVFIQNIHAVMTLPQDVSPDKITQIVYAIHGVGAYQSYIQDSRTLIYDAQDISGEATLSISARLPKTLLNPPLTKRLGFWISSLPAINLTYLAIILPVITLIIMLFMIVKRRRDQIISFNAEAIPKPPAALPPAIPGVLLDGQVGSREIAATLIDLANRGYLYITNHGATFTFGERKEITGGKTNKLEPFERILLGKIFMPDQYKSTKKDVEMRVGHHIFSRKMAQVFLEIYNEATELGYFIKNPAITHRRWRYTGILFFFLGVAGFVYSLVWAPDPKFTLILWAGEVASASVIIKFSGLMPSRSREGSRSLNQWMAFRRYLKQNAPIEANSSTEDLFNRYLPYAIVFGVEAEWAKRFLKAPFTKPEWYEAKEYVSSLERYIGGLYPLINYVGNILAGSHEPTVE